MFLETSAKTAYNVVESFNLSAQCILNNIQKNGVDPNINSNIKIFKKMELILILIQILKLMIIQLIVGDLMDLIIKKVDVVKLNI